MRGYSPERVISPIDRVMRRVVHVGDCWTFIGSGNRYGAVRVGSKIDGTARMRKAHRITYEAFVGSVPDRAGARSCSICRRARGRKAQRAYQARRAAAA